MGRKITDDILIDYLNGNISEADRCFVEEWLQAEDHRKYFESLQSLWAMTALEPPVITQTETAWIKVRQQIAEREHDVKRVWFRPRYLIHVAASLLLLLGVYSLWTMNRPTNLPATASIIHTQTKPVKNQQKIEPIQPSAAPAVASRTVKKNTKNNIVRRPESKLPESIPALAAAHSKEEICNSTNCPLEICIQQSLECDGKTTTFSHCSLLAPDASGLLHYRSVNDTTEYCRAPVAEIRIKRVNTGETIVLNAETNVTAQEFFDYITGNKKGDIVAGIFDTDCNNHCIDQSIRIDNRLGIPMILQ